MNFLTVGLLFLKSDPAKALYNAQNFIKYENFMMFPINTIKWWIIEFIYGIANFASSLLNHVVGVGNFLTKSLNGTGELGQWITGARMAALTIAASYLIWVAVRFVIAKQPPQFKNVILQLITSVFLILSLSDITNTLVNYSTQWYQDFTQTSKGKKDKNTDVSDLPFQVVANSTNDIEYLIMHQFDGTNAPAKKKINISTSSIQNKVPEVQYGFNNLKKNEVNEGKVPFDQVIQWPDVDGGGSGSNQGYLNKLDGDSGKAEKSNKFLFGYLIYESKSYTDEKGKLQVTAPDIPRVGTTIFAFGGYPRFQVDFFPVVFVLCALIVAYAFAAYAIIKSYLELGLMNILGIFLFAVDIDNGNKTKQVIQAVFSTSLLVALQGFEIAFYKIAMLWGMNVKDTGLFGSGATRAWVFVVYALAATIMLITGSQKVTDWFGVDTGAQHGWKAAGSVMYAGNQIGKGAKRAVTSPFRMATAAKNARDSVGHALNTKGSLKRDAKAQAKEGARQQVLDQMAGTTRYGTPTNKPEAAEYSPREVNQGENFGGSVASSTPSSADGTTKLSDMANLTPSASRGNFNGKDRVASQIKQTPAAAKKEAKMLNKGARASEQAIQRQGKRNAIAGNMKSAMHNAKQIMRGKKPAAPLKPMQSLNTSKGTVEQLAKPYSSHDPNGEGLTYDRSTGIEGIKQDAKRALGSSPTPSAETQTLSTQYHNDQKALAQAIAGGAPKEEVQMLKQNLATSRQALDDSIKQDRQNFAVQSSKQGSMKQTPVNEVPKLGQKDNVIKNQKKINANPVAKEKQTRLAGKSQPVSSNKKISGISSKNQNVTSKKPKTINGQFKKVKQSRPRISGKKPPKSDLK